MARSLLCTGYGKTSKEKPTRDHKLTKSVLSPEERLPSAMDNKDRQFCKKSQEVVSVMR